MRVSGLVRAFRVLAVVAASALFTCSAGAGATHKPIPRAPARFSYDEIEIGLFPMLGEGSVDSPPGSFERDYRWAATHTGDADHRYASLAHVSYFDGWTRVETDESIEIANRRRMIVIIADKETSTFRRYTGAQAQAMLAPGRLSQQGTIAATVFYGPPGSAVYSVRDTYADLPTIGLDGMEAAGRRTFETTIVTDATGSCASGRFSVAGHRWFSVTTEYRAPFATPSAPAFYLPGWNDRTIEPCHPRTVRAVEPAAQRHFEDRLLLYKREEDSMVQRGKASVLSIDITELGDFHALTESDRDLLELPSKYVDACLTRPVPSDCEPLARYARLNARVIVHRLGAGFDRVMQSQSGSIWFTERGRGRLGWVNGDNVVHEVALPDGTVPAELTETPDGTIWFTETSFATVGGRRSGIGSYARNGTISEPVIFANGKDIGGISSASDGSVWFSTAQDNGSVGEITPAGAIKYFPLIPESFPLLTELRVGPDGSLWVAEYGNASIARLTPRGEVTRFPLGVRDGPFGLAFGRAGLWFTAGLDVGYLNMNTQLHIFAVPRDDGSADEIVALPNGDAAFTEPYAGRIGIVSPQGNFVEFSVPGEPDGLMLDKGGNAWYTDRDNLRMIPDFLQATQARAAVSATSFRFRRGSRVPGLRASLRHGTALWR